MILISHDLPTKMFDTHLKTKTTTTTIKKKSQNNQECEKNSNGTGVSARKGFQFMTRFFFFFLVFGFAVEGNKERQQEIRENIQKASKDIAEEKKNF